MTTSGPALYFDGRTSARLAATVPVGYPADPAEVALVIAMLGAPALRSVTGAHSMLAGFATTTLASQPKGKIINATSKMCRR